MKIYLDNALLATANKTGNVPSAANPAQHLHLGSMGDAAFRHAGLMDEVFFSDIVRSVNWETTAWNNENDPSTFWSVGAEEAVFTQPVVMI